MVHSNNNLFSNLSGMTRIDSAFYKKRIQLITLADSEETDPQDGGEPAEIPENKLKQGSDDPDDSNDISLF